MKEDMEEILIKYFSDDITRGERERLLEWLNGSRENRQQFILYKDLWDASELLSEDKHVLDNEWKKVQHRLTRDNKRKISTYHLLKIAAVAVIILGIGFLIGIMLPLEQGNMSMEMSSVHVPQGSKSEIELRDGTRIWLNAGSILRYPKKNLNDKRIVYLEGEAYFDVHKNKKKQFIVKTSEIDIKALGTAFNVKSYHDENTIEATLVEGKIEIETTEKKIILDPRQKITYLKDPVEWDHYGQLKITKKDNESRLFIENNVDTELHTAWKDKRLVFKNQSFRELAVRLERWFDVVITIKDDEIKDYNFTGTFENETIEQALNALRLTAPFDYSMNQNNIIITRKNKQEKHEKLNTG